VTAAPIPEHSAVPVSPSLEPLVRTGHIGSDPGGVSRRSLYVLLLATLIGLAAVPIAEVLMALIGLITHLCFQGRWVWSLGNPGDNHLGALVIAVPVLGSVVVGLMARYGSPAIRGHGIPEAMEQILTNRSRIPARVLWLKPLSAAISIGTGGPFGAEGPIIATGGALGSLVGQWLHITPDERKTLLGAGAAAGMTAVFGTPVSAVLLAVELLLFEFRPASLLPVVGACAAAAAGHIALHGNQPFFAMPALAWPHPAALVGSALLGAVVGLVAVIITRALYAIEDGFERLPVHWMWWPALGAIVVGVVGWWQPRTLGVGYANITDALAGTLATRALLVLGAAKLVSWAIALGSGTSGGTLAPLMTIGACLGAVLGHAVAVAMPWLGLDPRLAALIGMAAIFAGASRALFASVVFALEATWQTPALLALMIGCACAYLVSGLLMRETIMTEKIARRGVHVPNAYQADPFMQERVAAHASMQPVSLQAQRLAGDAIAWLDSEPQACHQGYPVVDAQGCVLGVLTRRDLQRASAGDATLQQLLQRAPVVVRADDTLHDALNLMVLHDIGRLPVVGDDGRTLRGMLTRSDVLGAWRRRTLDATRRGH
jgi:H+/Cl- antiporter ClcA